MSGFVYSGRIIGPLTLSNTPTAILATVPAGQTWVIRWLGVVNNSATIPTTIRVGIGPANVGANRFYRRSLGVEEQFFFDLRVPLSAGETVGAYADNLGVASLTLTGFKFLNDS